MVAITPLPGRLPLLVALLLLTPNALALPPAPKLTLSPPVPELLVNYDTQHQDAPAPEFKSAFVDHNDPIAIDPALKLPALVANTLEKMPDVIWLDALEKEATTLHGRGDSWFAGAAQASLRYQEATSGTLHYGDAAVQVPLWNLGQRFAERRVVKFAHDHALAEGDALKLRVAGLVRQSLWAIALASLDYEQTQIETKTLEQLLAKVTRRAELGDLPRADVLLAKTEVLQKHSVLAMMEAELMHARKRYLSITQGAKLPAQFHETLAALNTIQQNHPALQSLNSQIARKQAEIQAARLVGSGQTQLAIGINSDESTDPRSNHTESFNIGVNVPFGGAAHTLDPHLATLNVELSKLMAEREQLHRDLELAHHEAEHNLEVNRVELKIATELQQVAEEHLRMTELSFSVGEINLIDLLKIQSRTQQAVLNAKQRSVMLERDTALYNQAVGLLP